MNVLVLSNDGASFSLHYIRGIAAITELREWLMAGRTSDSVSTHPLLLELIRWSDVVVLSINTNNSGTNLVESVIFYARNQNKRIIIIREDAGCSLSPGAGGVLDAGVPCEAELIEKAISGEIRGIFESTGEAQLPRDIPRHNC